MARRTRGEGSVTFKKKLKLWAAKVPIDEFDAKGRRKFAYAYGKTAEEASRKRANLQQKVNDNAMTEPHRMTVMDLMAAYLEHKQARVKPRTHELYERDVVKFINPKLGGILISKLMPLQIERMQSEVLRKHGARTAKGARDTLSRALRQAVRWRLMMYNPADGVDAVKPKTAEMEVWEPEEVRHFLEVARTSPLFALFYLALTTGMRRGELLALSWKDVLLGALNPSITVRNTVSMVRNKVTLGDPKTGKGARRIALYGDQVDVLIAHQAAQEIERSSVGSVLQNQGFVFPSEVGTVLSPGNFEGRHWYPLRSKSQCTPIRFHDIRHTYASLAIRAGMDIRLLADRLGHRDPAFTLRVYAHVFEQYRQSGAMPLEKLLAEPVQRP
jgi:integrase